MLLALRAAETVERGVPMIREPNPVDFWRGFALVTIFINHVPGLYFGEFTHKHLSLSDSAELFVFLAGWGLALMLARYEARGAYGEALHRIGSRVVTLYAVHLMSILIAIAILASAAIAFDNPLLLEWHNASAVFNDPIRAHIGLVTLSYQLGYFDILPLYVVLLAGAPIVVVISWVAPGLLLPASLGLYLSTLIFNISIPTWPTNGYWFFNPMAWQLVFVLGFVMARDVGVGAFVRRNLSAIRGVSIVIVVLAAVVVWFDLKPNPIHVPEPKLLFVDYKSFVTPMRLIQFLALAAVFSAFNSIILTWLRPLANELSTLGRNSLTVFCVGSVLSLSSQVVRYVYKGEFWTDCAIVVVGIGLLIATARLVEWPRVMQTTRRARAESEP